MLDSCSDPIAGNSVHSEDTPRTASDSGCSNSAVRDDVILVIHHCDVIGSEQFENEHFS